MEPDSPPPSQQRSAWKRFLRKFKDGPYAPIQHHRFHSKLYEDSMLKQMVFTKVRKAQETARNQLKRTLSKDEKVRPYVPFRPWLIARCLLCLSHLSDNHLLHVSLWSAVWEGGVSAVW